MSVLIKGMEMPSGCLSCDFCNPFVDEPYCRRLMRKTSKVTRLEDCPLVPVPPHGALIDRDDFFATCPELVDGYKTITDGLVALPAEEAE